MALQLAPRSGYTAPVANACFTNQEKSCCHSSSARSARERP
jgi:hypothetical protein